MRIRASPKEGDNIETRTRSRDTMEGDSGFYNAKVRIQIWTR